MAMSVRSESGEIVRAGVEGKCRCGAAATTEVQVGWFADANNGAGGGQYDEICDTCVAADYPELVADSHAMRIVQGKSRVVYTDSDGDEYVIIDGNKVYLEVTDERGNVHRSVLD